jgi:hypothetical protein
LNHRTHIAFVASLVLLGAMLVTACSSADKTPTGSNTTLAPVVTRVYPADRSVDVPVNATLSIKFNTPMDTLSVLNHMHLSGGQHMETWMDSLVNNGGMHGGMGMGMSWGDMMHWMDSIHVPGQFHWNGTLDSCDFIPGAALDHMTDYMLIMTDSMMSQQGYFMGTQSMQLGVFMSHFQCEP